MTKDMELKNDPLFFHCKKCSCTMLKSACKKRLETLLNFKLVNISFLSMFIVLNVNKEKNYMEYLFQKML